MNLFGLTSIASMTQLKILLSIYSFKHAGLLTLAVIPFLYILVSAAAAYMQKLNT